MDFLYKRINRNRHFQIVKENRWIPTGRVYTGLGLYKDINEVSRLRVIVLMSKKERENFTPERMDKELEIYHDMQKEILPCVSMKINKKIAEISKVDGKIIARAGWEF